MRRIQRRSSGISPRGCKAQDQQQDQPHHDRPHVGGTRQEMLLQGVVRRHRTGNQVHHLQAHRLRLNPHVPDQEAAEHRAPVVAGAAHDHHHPDEKGKAQRLVGGGRELPVERGEHGAGDADYRRAEHEHLQVAGGDVLAHGTGGGLVVADGAHHAAPRRAQRGLRQPGQNHQHGQEQAGVAQLHDDRGQVHVRHAERHGPVLEPRRVLQVDLVRDRARQAGDVLDPARQPLLVLEDCDDDLGDAEGGDCQVVGAEAEADLTHPGRGGGERSAHQPGQDDGKAEPAEVAAGGGIDRFDGIDSRREHGAGGHGAADQQQRDCQPPVPRLAETAADKQHGEDGERRQRKPCQYAGAARPPCVGHRRHGNQHAGQPAERGEAHYAGVEQPRVAPLDVDAERHDGGDEAQVEDGQGQRPALHHAHQAHQCRHGREQDRLAGHPGQPAGGAPAHVDLPPKMPVGLTSSTTTRMQNETANL